MEYKNITLKSGKKVVFPVITEDDQESMTLELYDLFIEAEDGDDETASYKLLRALVKTFLSRKEQRVWNRLTLAEMAEAAEQIEADEETSPGKE